MTTTSLKALVQGAYDLQKLRVQAGNRICQSFYQSHGVAPGEKPKDEMDAEDQKVLKRVLAEYKLLAAGLSKRDPKKTFKPTKYLPEFSTVQLVAQYQRLSQVEELAFKDIETALIGLPIYEQFLKSVTGCGPAMSGVLLATLDIHRATYPSQFWAAAGLDVAPDGRGRSRRKEHLVVRKYIDKDGNEAERLGITFNPFLKTKMFVLASCFMRNNNPYYRGVYDNYKHRIQNHPNWADKSDGHRNNASRRYMAKIFLVDLWKKWREIEGLPVTPSYAEAKLGMAPHHRSARDIAAE